MVMAGTGSPLPGVGRARPSLPMLLTDGFTRVMNLAGALGDGMVGIFRGVLVRPPERKPSQNSSWAATAWAASMNSSTMSMTTCPAPLERFMSPTTWPTK